MACRSKVVPLKRDQSFLDDPSHPHLCNQTYLTIVHSLCSFWVFEIATPGVDSKAVSGTVTRPTLTDLLILICCQWLIKSHSIILLANYSEYQWILITSCYVATSTVWKKTFSSCLSSTGGHGSRIDVSTAHRSATRCRDSQSPPDSWRR